MTLDPKIAVSPSHAIKVLPFDSPNARTGVAYQAQCACGWRSGFWPDEDGAATAGDGHLTISPPRGPLSPEVEKAARTIHRTVWKEPYKPGEGPMHHAGGGYWRAELLARADMWERMAEAARVCAGALPDA